MLTAYWEWEQQGPSLIPVECSSVSAVTRISPFLSGTSLAILGHPGVHFPPWSITALHTQGLSKVAHPQVSRPGLAFVLGPMTDFHQVITEWAGLGPHLLDPW